MRCSCCKNICGFASGTLSVLIIVNVVLTVAQLTCGIMANSLSLIGDAVLMGMDGVSYGISLYVERRKAVIQDQARIDRHGAMFSAALLGATTCIISVDSIRRLLPSKEDVDGGAGDEIEVDSNMMFGFTTVNLVADVVIFLMSWYCGTLSVVTDGDENLNMVSAFAHLAADTVRGVAVLLCSTLAIVGVVDPVSADAYCSLFVCLFVFSATVQLVCRLVRAKPSTTFKAFDDTEMYPVMDRDTSEDAHADDADLPTSQVSAVTIDVQNQPDIVGKSLTAESQVESLERSPDTCSEEAGAT